MALADPLAPSQARPFRRRSSRLRPTTVFHDLALAGGLVLLVLRSL